MKAVKRVTSVMLMLAMVSSLVITAPKTDAKEAADSIYVTVNIQAPFEVYYDDVSSGVLLDEADLKDDFDQLYVEFIPDLPEPSSVS